MTVEDDDELATVATDGKEGQRVTIQDLELEIEDVEYYRPALSPTTTLCFAKLRNGFFIVGKSACADPHMFDALLGQKLARDHVLRQMWPLLGYCLREKLHLEKMRTDDS